MCSSLEEDDLETDYYLENMMPHGGADRHKLNNVRPLLYQNIELYRRHVEESLKIGDNFNTHHVNKRLNKQDWEEVEEQSPKDAWLNTSGLDMSDFTYRLSTYKHFPAGLTNVSSSRLARDGLFYRNNMLTCSSCKYTVDPSKYSDILDLHEFDSPNCAYVLQRVGGGASVRLEMYQPNSRMRTNDITTNGRQVKSAEQSATASSRYVPTQSSVIMPTGEISGGTSNPDPRYTGQSRITTSRHRVPSPPSVSSTLAAMDRPSYEVAQSAKVNEIQHNVNVSRSAALFPALSEEVDRVFTFTDWPHKIPDKRSVAAAGFIFHCFPDHVKCFFCGLTLTSWEPNDDPFFEHAKFTNACTWLEERKGKNFISESKRRYKQMQIEGITECGIGDLNQTKKIGSEQKLGEKKVDETAEKIQPVQKLEKEKKDEIINSKVKLAFEYGFDSEVIMAVIQQHMKETNGVFSMSNDEMISKILSYNPDNANQKQPNAPANDDAENALLRELSNLQLGESKTFQSSSNDVAASGDDVLKELEDLKDMQTCKICLDRPVDTLFTPCNHLVTCNECAKGLKSCPICRGEIRDRLKIYQS